MGLPLNAFRACFGMKAQRESKTHNQVAVSPTAALYAALWSDNYDQAERAIRNGAEVNHPGYAEKTRRSVELDMASPDYAAIVRSLPSTPLHTMALRGSPSLVELLLRNGADAALPFGDASILLAQLDAVAARIEREPADRLSPDEIELEKDEWTFVAGSAKSLRLCHQLIVHHIKQCLDDKLTQPATHAAQRIRL